MLVVNAQKKIVLQNWLPVIEIVYLHFNIYFKTKDCFQIYFSMYCMQSWAVFKYFVFKYILNIYKSILNTFTIMYLEGVFKYI